MKKILIVLFAFVALPFAIMAQDINKEKVEKEELTEKKEKAERKEKPEKKETQEGVLD